MIGREHELGIMSTIFGNGFGKMNLEFELRVKPTIFSLLKSFGT